MRIKLMFTDVLSLLKTLTPALSNLFVYFFNIELTCPSEIYWFNIYWLIDDSSVCNQCKSANPGFFFINHQWQSAHSIGIGKK
jgi:hypothetical protein